MTDTPEIERLRRLKKRRTAARRRQAIASGTYVPPMVDPSRARLAVADLKAYGLGHTAIGHLTGLHPNLLDQLMSPTHPAYRKVIRRETEEVILAARFDLDRLRPKHHVHAAGTQRRIRALARIGYGLSDLAPLLDVSLSQVGQYANPRGGFVFAGTARRVRDLYHDLYLTLGPSLRTAELATRQGWAPPWAWDDDTMDHPDTLPDLSCLRPAGQRPRPSEDTIEDVEWILAHEDYAATREHVARRLGVTEDAITQALARAGEQRTRAVRERALGASVEGPLDEETAQEVLEALAPLQRIRERFYANTEALGGRVTTRVAS